MRKRKNSKSSKLGCAFCQGKGGQPGAERLSCIVCGGSGRVTVRQPYNVCKECVGTGKKKGTNLYCLACHGKGFVPKPFGPGSRRQNRLGIEESRHPSLAKSPASKTRRKKKNPPSLKLWRARKKRIRKPAKKKRVKKSVPRHSAGMAAKGLATKPKTRKVPTRTAGRGSSPASPRLGRGRAISSRFINRESSAKSGRSEIGTKAAAKKGRKSPPTSRLGREASRVGFFKKFLGTFKIL